MTIRVALALLVLVTAGAARADDAVVLAIDGKDLYVGLGAEHGVGAGSELELLHEVAARDPRTGVMLRDRFSLGSITVIKSGARISVAHAGPELARRVVAGDRVRLVSPRRAFVDPWAEQVAASKGQVAPPRTPASPASPAGAPIDHAGIARAAWQDTLGQPIEARIARWTRLLREDDPATPYRAAIQREIASLEAQLAARQAALAKARSTDDGDRDVRVVALVAQLDDAARDRGALVVAAPIDRAVPGRPVELAFLASRPGAIRSAWLYVRPEDAPGYNRIELRRDGDAYLRGTIGAELVREGELAWYVVAVTERGEVEAVGSIDTPRVIAVDPLVAEAPIERGRTHIDGHVDYVDFDGNLEGGYDQYVQAELDFTYRFLTPVYAVRLGFGTLSGVGGPKDVIDLGMRCVENGVYQCRELDFSYVYTELELRVRPTVAIMLRPQAGLLTTDRMDAGGANRCSGADTSLCEFATGFGARGRLRLGDERGTNLVLGASFTGGIGTLLEAAYQWLPHEVVPVQITVQVTDQPVVEDFGVRLIADVGLRRVSWVYPSVRLSYQARDIDHSGISGGFALNFDW